MILSVYCYRDKKLGRFQTPVVNNIEKETAAVTLARAVVDLTKEQKNKIRDLELYYLGEFDDKTGVIKCFEKEFIVSIDSLIAESEVVSHESRSEEESN